MKCRYGDAEEHPWMPNALHQFAQSAQASPRRLPRGFGAFAAAVARETR